MFTDKKITFIGSGIMAEAMIRGLLAKDILKSEQIIASGPREERGNALSERYNVRVTIDNTAAAEEGQIIVLSVKPSQEIANSRQWRSCWAPKLVTNGRTNF